jgi:hypothetical protein
VANLPPNYGNGLYLHFKFQVHQKIIASAVACPKQQKSRFGFLDPLEVKVWHHLIIFGAIWL